jgi:hypothetical protein
MGIRYTWRKMGGRRMGEGLVGLVAGTEVV